MATYSNIGIKLITTGDESGTWGTSTNTNFSDVLDEAIAGAVTYNISSDANFTLTVSDGTSSDARHAVIKFTSTTLTATRTCTFAPDDLQKTWVVINATTGGQSLTFKQGSAGATVTVPNGESAIIYSDGAGSTNGAITLVLDSFTNTKITTGTLNATTLDLTNLEVTNIKAKDGTAAASIADSTGVVSFTANPVLSGGTANGVLYLNGSKVATSGTDLVFNSTGLGVGTSSPAVKLDVAGASTTQARIQMAGQADVRVISDTGNAIFGTYSNHPLYIRTNTTDVMVLTAAGDVGIGTSSPSYKFQASGGKATTGIVASLINIVSGGNAKLHFSDEITYNWTVGTTGNAFTVSSGESSTTAGTERLRIDSSGNLGLGVTPSAANVKTFEVGVVGNTLTGIGGGDVALMSNAYYNSGFKYAGSNLAASYRLQDGVHKWNIAASGTAGNTITFTQAMTLDASGNLGVGTTSPASILDVQSASAIAKLTSTTGTNGVTYRTVNTGGTSYFGRDSSSAGFGSAYATIVWGTGAYPMLFGTNDTERARITSGGDLAVGGTTAVARITSIGTTPLYAGSDTTGGTYLGYIGSAPSNSISCYVGWLPDSVGSSGVNGDLGLFSRSSTGTSIRFFTGSTSPTERARITSGGFFKASNAGTYEGSTSSYHELRTSTSDEFIARFTTTASSLPYGFIIKYTAAAPNNSTDSIFWTCADSAATRATMRSNGGLANYQSNNADLSDIRTKKDIAPALSMWDKIGALEIVTYKYNDQTHDDVNVGVIAQQVEGVEPAWIDTDGFGETPEGDEPLKTVYTKDIYFAAIKALQEAMTRIEQLEAKVAALESK